MERPLPITSCTVCGKAGYNISLTNVQCGQRFNGKRRRGVNESAIALYDWAKCPKCNGHGCNLTPGLLRAKHVFDVTAVGGSSSEMIPMATRERYFVTPVIYYLRRSHQP